MQTVAQRIVVVLIAWRVPLAVLGIVAAVTAYFPAGELSFDRSIENMFAPDDPLLEPYEKLKRTFGGNEVVLAVYVDDDLYGWEERSGEGFAPGMRRLAGLRQRIEKVPGVKGALSLDQPIGEAIVEEDNPLAGRIRKLFEGYTHDAQGTTAAVVCMLVPQSETDVPRRETIDRLRSIMSEFPSGMIAGEPVMVVDGFRYVEEDGRRLGLWSTILLGTTILVCFRNIRWVIIPLVVVQLALVLTRATLVWSGLRLSMVSSMLTAIVTVVGIATVIHVIVRFREARLAGLPPRRALLQSGRLLAAPVFWSCSTTAVGFASLLTAEVGPVRDFGLMMAIGSLLVIVSVALVLPALALAGRVDTDPRRAWGEGLLDSGLSRLVACLGRWPRTVALVTMLFAAVAAAGAYRLEVETDFTRNFRSASPIVRSYEFVEQKLGGAGVWDVILPAPKNLNWTYLRRVRRLEERLRAEVVVQDPQGRPTAGLTKVLSLADAVIAGSPRDVDSLRPRLLRDSLVRTGLKRMGERIPVFMQGLHGEDSRQPGRHYVRVMLRARERQPSEQKRGLIRQVEEISREEFPPSSTTSGAEVTGFFVLLTNLIDSVIRDQWITFGVATVGIGLMMVVALRNGLVALAALVPNALPILVVTGLMGWLGLKINMGAVMIAAVSMGLSIDSSIHYITAFRRARGEGRSIDEAIAAVHQSVGRAMVFSTVALVVGFTVLCASQFVPTVFFGALVTLTMLGGLAGNLVVLPLLLRLVAR